VRIEPVQDELVRAVRSENAALIEELRKAEAAKEAAEASPRIATVAAPKPPKASQATGTSHKPVADPGGLSADRGGVSADRKGERVNEAEAKAPTAPWMNGCNPQWPFLWSLAASIRRRQRSTRPQPSIRRCPRAGIAMVRTAEAHPRNLPARARRTHHGAAATTTGR
jgi:hypothetical protein